MQVAKIMAGYTLGEAEQFRRAMTHKRSYEAMERLCDDLVERMLARGHTKDLAEEIRRMVIGFADYGFVPRLPVRPHRVDLGHPEAALPREYYAAILNSQPMGFYAPTPSSGTPTATASACSPSTSTSAPGTASSRF